MRHTQITMPVRTTSAADFTASISPLSADFRHSAHPCRPYRADAAPTHGLSHQHRYHRSAVDVEGSLQGEGTSSALRRYRRCALKFSSTPAPFRHSPDLFRHWVLFAGTARAYATPPHGYPEQARRKTDPDVRLWLAPPRGIRINTPQPFGQKFGQMKFLVNT